MMAKRRTAVVDVEAFNGFGAGWHAFLAALDADNTREWFHANKEWYERDLREPMGALVISLSLALAAREIPLLGDPKSSIFRLNRDVRFTRDKQPYKNNVSAVLTRDGTKHSQGLVYIQVGLDECMAAAGFYVLEPDELAAMRTAIAAQPARWQAIEAGLAEHGLSISRDQVVARAPRGIEAPPEVAEAVRLKSFTVRRPLRATELTSPALVDQIADFAEAARPLLEFGWRALT